MTAPAAAIPYFADAVERALAATGGVELTVEVQLRERLDIVNKLLDTDGVHSATLIACQSEAGN